MGLKSNVALQSIGDLLETKKQRKAITGIKPSENGFHLGHFIGNIQPMINGQNEHECFFIFADLQLLNSDAKYCNSELLTKNIILMIKQALSLGIDPQKVTFVQESVIKKDRLCELMLLADFIGNTRISRLPLFKSVEEPWKMSLYLYPILQAMDAIITDADIAFSNIDNKATIELINELIRKVNKNKGTAFKQINLVHGKTEMLVGTDGKKMSKSKNNCIFFTDSDAEVRKKINKMFTDPNRITCDIPGDITNNVVFKYLKVFLLEEEYNKVQEEYCGGRISDMSTKELLFSRVNELIGECNSNINKYSDEYVLDLLHMGNMKSIDFGGNRLCI